MRKLRGTGACVLSVMAVAVMAGCAGAAGNTPTASAGSTQTPTSDASATATPRATTAATPTAPVATPSPATTWKIGPNGECDAGQLDFSLGSRPMDSGMSQFYWNLQMTNASDTTCTLTGYPQVRLVSSLTGEGIGASSGRDTGQPEGIVEMAPGASAYSVLHLSQAGVYDCPIVPVTELAVTPPYWDTSRTVPTPNEIDGCDDLTTELVSAGPLTATARE